MISIPKKKNLKPEKVKEIYNDINTIGFRKTSEKHDLYVSFLQRLKERYENKKKMELEKKRMKAIIIAAGMGSRLKEMTKYTPKPLLEIEGASIFHREVSALREIGIDDIVVVRGYQKEKFNFPGFNYFDNDDYTDNNILKSLFYAEPAMDDGFICTYADSIFNKKIFKQLLDVPYDFCIAVDKNWQKRYASRTDHPTDEAELVQIKDDKAVNISKFFNPDACDAEFIGVAKFSKKGAEILRRNYHRALESKTCHFSDGQRFHDAISIEKAYITDMIQELIERGYPIHVLYVDDGWVEIDTQQDFEYAKQMIKDGKI